MISRKIVAAGVAVSAPLVAYALWRTARPPEGAPPEEVPPEEARGYDVQVHVGFADTGEDARGATVYVDGVLRGTTDSRGFVTVPNVPAGNHIFRADPPSGMEGMYSSDSRTVDVAAPTAVMLSLRRRGTEDLLAVRTFWYKGPGDYGPLPGVDLYIEAPVFTGFRYLGKTGSDARFSKRITIPEGKFRLKAVVKGYADYIAAFRWPDVAGMEIKLYLRPG